MHLMQILQKKKCKDRHFDLNLYENLKLSI